MEQIVLIRTAALNASVIQAFRAGKPLKSQAFRTDGSNFYLFDKLIAKRTIGGIAVSNAGFPTAKTYATFRELGVRVSTKGGVTKINGKVVDTTSAAFMKIPSKDISKRTAFATPESARGPKTNRTGFSSTTGLTGLRKFREQSRLRTTGSKKGVPLSETATQPSDQLAVTRITGVKSKGTKRTVGNITHHVLPKSKTPGMAFNKNNAIQISEPEHKELHKLNKISKLAKRIQRIAIRGTREELDEVSEGIGNVMRSTNKTKLEQGLFDKFVSDDTTAAKQLGVLGRTRDDIIADPKELAEKSTRTIAIRNDKGKLFKRQDELDDANINLSRRLNKKNPHSVFDRLQNITKGRARVAQTPDVPRSANIKINAKDGREIANEYDRLKHDPNNPQVSSAYNDFIKETNQQYADIQKRGIKVNRIGEGVKPYETSSELHRDIAMKKINYFPTDKGFGRDADKFSNHPLLGPSPFKDTAGNTLTNNDTFRVVHDINGHNFGEKAGFSPTGEQNAFETHKLFYSENAQRALFTETAGQSNWASFSKEFGENNRTTPDKMVFAEQKAGLFPDKMIFKRWHR